MSSTGYLYKILGNIFRLLDANLLGDNYGVYKYCKQLQFYCDRFCEAYESKEEQAERREEFEDMVKRTLGAKP